MNLMSRSEIKELFTRYTKHVLKDLTLVLIIVPLFVVLVSGCKIMPCAVWRTQGTLTTFISPSSFSLSCSSLCLFLIFVYIFILFILLFFLLLFSKLFSFFYRVLLLRKVSERPKIFFTVMWEACDDVTLSLSYVCSDASDILRMTRRWMLRSCATLFRRSSTAKTSLWSSATRS